MVAKERRVMVYVDGFNLYHTIKDFRPNKLNLQSLFSSLSMPGEKVVGIKYFSAYAEWLPQKTISHKKYVADLQSTGVEVVLGKYKRKTAKCSATCKEIYQTHEEKETDVNIALHLVCDAQDNLYDKAKLVTVDSDLATAVRTVKKRYPDKSVLIIKPQGRGRLGRELLQASQSTGYVLREAQVKKHMF